MNDSLRNTGAVKNKHGIQLAYARLKLAIAAGYAFAVEASELGRGYHSLQLVPATTAGPAVNSRGGFANEPLEHVLLPQLVFD